jgi:hypothetical protein
VVLARRGPAGAGRRRWTADLNRIAAHDAHAGAGCSRAGRGHGSGTPDACCRTGARRQRKPSSVLLACHRPTPSAAGTASTFPAGDPPGRACGQSLNRGYNGQLPTPAGGRCNHQPLFVWARPAVTCSLAPGEPKQTHSLPIPPYLLGVPGPSRVPANPVRASRLRPALCAHPVRRAARHACRPDLHEARRQFLVLRAQRASAERRAERPIRVRRGRRCEPTTDPRIATTSL